MVVLKGITWQNPRGYDPLVAGSRAWKQVNPYVRVEWQQLPWYQFEDRILRSLAAGDRAFDVVMFDHPWTGTLSKHQWLIPWNSLVSNDYLSALRQRVVAPSTESYELNGNLWALPLDAACHAGLYRADLVDAATLPRTWSAVAQWAAEHHRPPHRYGLVLSVEGVLGSCLFLSLMAGLGHPPYLDEPHPTADRVAATHVLNQIKELLRYVPPGSTRWGPWDIYGHLCSHDNVGYSPSIFAYVNYFTGERGRHLRLTRVPDWSAEQPGRPILGGVGLGIAHTCDHCDAARDLGLYLMSDHVQQRIFPAHSGQPAARSAWECRDVNRRCNGFYNDLATNMATAYVRPRYPDFHAVELECGRALQAWWDGKQTLEETLTRLRAE